MSGFFSFVALAVAVRALRTYWALPVAWGIERLKPRAAVPRAAQLQALSFILVAGPIGTFFMALSIAAQRGLGLKPLLSLPVTTWLAGVPGGALMAAAVGVAVGDFLFYWCHRAQHAIPLLWRFHAMHHSIADLSAVNAYAHWSEDMIRIAFCTVPLALIVSVNSGVEPILITALLTLQVYYVHSVAGFHLGPLSRIVVDNRFHRIHHSVEPQHFNKNFGGALPIWDSLFRTAYWPDRAEWPATGLAGVAPPQTIGAYLGWSFGRRRRAPSPQLAEASS